MYQYTETPGYIRCLETGMVIPPGHWMMVAFDEWVAAGNTPAPVPPRYLPNTPEHHRAIRDAAWAWMKAWVVDRGYDGIETCCSYYNSSVDRYRLEARAMVQWRDAVNQALEALVLNPPPGVDTWEEVCALLPQPEFFDWPAKVELPLDEVPPVGL